MSPIRKSHAELARELPLVLDDGGQLDLLVNNAGVLHSGERFGQRAARRISTTASASMRWDRSC